jgi:hypothetical protein
MSDPIIIEGRPDFADPMFGKTVLKRFPPYVYSPRGLLIHRVERAEAWWYDHQCDRLIRRQSPVLLAYCFCGMSFRIEAGRGKTCAVPSPEAVICGKCQGERATFAWKDKDGRPIPKPVLSSRRWDAKRKTRMHRGGKMRLSSKSKKRIVALFTAGDRGGRGYARQVAPRGLTAPRAVHIRRDRRRSQRLPCKPRRARFRHTRLILAYGPTYCQHP